MLSLAVILTALAVLAFETLMALRATGNVRRAFPYATLATVVLTAGILLLVFG